MKKVTLFLATSFLFLGIGHAQYAIDMDVNMEIPTAKKEFGGLRAFRTVLPGVLYRGGGSGGARPMSEAQTQLLCQAGFSNAGYLYPNGMNGNKTVSCQMPDGSINTMDYKVYGFRPRDARRVSMEMIYNVIKTGSGPVFMHCWNGWHASGEIAAIALMQFCGWSGKAAGDYWKENIGDKANLPKYGKIPHQHIAHFQPFEDLRISAEEQERVCP